MAGSFGHVHDPEQERAFRFDLIENMGDAWEACEHMHLIILLLARGDEAKLRAAVDESYEVLRGEKSLHPSFTNLMHREE